MYVPSPFHYGRDGHLPRAIVIHSMGGTLVGTDSWFRDPAAEVSAHYGVSLTGAIHQYVQEAEGAWANGRLETGNTWPYTDGVNPNKLTLSIETEDTLASLPVSDAQYAAVLALCQGMLTRWPSIEWLLSHRVISPKTRPSCAGNRWTGGRFIELAQTLGLPYRF